MNGEFDIFIDGNHLLEAATFSKTTYSANDGFFDGNDTGAEALDIGFRFSITGKIRHEKLLLQMINGSAHYTLEIKLKDISHQIIPCKVTPKEYWDEGITISLDSI